jgi:hypothetical protein
MNASQSWSHFKHGVAKHEFKEQLKSLNEDELRDVHKRMLRKRFASKTSVVTGMAGALPTFGLSLVGSIIGSRRSHVNSDRIELIEEVLKEKGWEGHKMGPKDYALPVTLGVVSVGIGLDAALHHVAEAAIAPPIDASTPLDPSMMSAAAGMVPPADPLLGIIDPTGLSPSPVDSITAIGGGMPPYDPNMMAQTSLPAIDPTTQIGTALPYDPTMIDQWGLSTIDPSAWIGSTTTPYDLSMINQPNFISPPIVDGLQTPFNDMGNAGYDLNSGADAINTGLQAGGMDLSNLLGSESAMNTQNLPSGSLMGAQPFGANAIASAGAVGIVTTATHATPLLHHAIHKGAEMLGKKGLDHVYYKAVDHKKPADVGAALPRRAKTPRYLSPQFVAVDRSTLSWGETVNDTAPDVCATVVPTPSGSSDIQVNEMNTRKNPFRTTRSAKQKIPVEAAPGSPDVRATVAPTPTGSSNIPVNEKNTRKNPFRTARSTKQRIPVEVSPGSPNDVLRAIAVSSFCGQQEGELSFKEGDIVDILERTDHGMDWWLGRKGSTVGTFLSDMVQILDTTIAKYSFDSKEEDELAFREGDVIEVLARTENRDEWWIGRKGTKVGVFPACYVEDLTLYDLY